MSGVWCAPKSELKAPMPSTMGLRGTRAKAAGTFSRPLLIDAPARTAAAPQKIQKLRCSYCAFDRVLVEVALQVRQLRCLASDKNMCMGADGYLGVWNSPLTLVADVMRIFLS